MFKFIDKFNEVKEATRTAISKVTANGGSAVTPVTSANASPITSRAANTTSDQSDNLLEPPGINKSFFDYQIYQIMFFTGSTTISTTPNKSEEEIPHPRSHSISALQSNDSPSHQIKSEKSTYSNAPTNPIDMQLKYENDRLKLALAQR